MLKILNKYENSVSFSIKNSENKYGMIPQFLIFKLFSLNKYVHDLSLETVLIKSRQLGLALHSARM